MHEGLDIGGVLGIPILAAESGRVDYAGWIGGYGNTIIVDHGGGMTTLYGHMHGFAVSAGQTVAIGQVIGYVGNSGFSQGPPPALRGAHRRRAGEPPQVPAVAGCLSGPPGANR